MKKEKIMVLSEYSKNVLSKNEESIALKVQLSLNDINIIVKELRSEGFLKLKEIKSQALGYGRDAPPSQYYLDISQKGEDFLKQKQREDYVLKYMEQQKSYIFEYAISAHNYLCQKMGIEVGELYEIFEELVSQNLLKKNKVDVSLSNYKYPESITSLQQYYL